MEAKKGKDLNPGNETLFFFLRTSAPFCPNILSYPFWRRIFVSLSFARCFSCLLRVRVFCGSVLYVLHPIFLYTRSLQQQHNRVVLGFSDVCWFLLT